jgi:hypothetical protein
LTDAHDTRQTRERLVGSIKNKSEESLSGLYHGIEICLKDRPGLYRKRLVRRRDYLADKVKKCSGGNKWDIHELESICWAIACIDELLGAPCDTSSARVK